MNLPLEIVLIVASNLTIRDLRNFRLANKQIARSTSSLLARNGTISVLNTSTSLHGLSELLKCQEIARSIRQLTFLHGIWPVCTRKQWETHPLLCGGNDRPNWGRIRTDYTAKSDEAFANYLEFITVEKSRTQEQDLRLIIRILASLENLRVVNITTVPTWQPHLSEKYNKLVKKIWIAANQQSGASRALHTILSTINRVSSSTLSNIVINGPFTSDDLHFEPPITLPKVQQLHLSFTNMLQSHGSAKGFLRIFPNLTHITVGFHCWNASTPDLLRDLLYEELQVLRLCDIWASEEDLLALFVHHQLSLRRLEICNLALSEGSWKSLFTRIRALNTEVRIIMEGDLWGRMFTDNICINAKASLLFAKFMQDSLATWPFS
ncbi:hypothetical protein V500_04394 [Pseudogymnoascus sp. VKM F-4518 (FW-2643)]|nr:hypothetical protein V500_04394 [Pseudogymnoascus sp. VKM F-4518 (FW-2643)]